MARNRLDSSGANGARPIIASRSVLPSTAWQQIIWLPVSRVAVVLSVCLAAPTAIADQQAAQRFLQSQGYVRAEDGSWHHRTGVSQPPRTTFERLDPQLQQRVRRRQQQRQAAMDERWQVFRQLASGDIDGLLESPLLSASDDDSGQASSEESPSLSLSSGSESGTGGANDNGDQTEHPAPRTHPSHTALIHLSPAMKQRVDRQREQWQRQLRSRHDRRVRQAIDERIRRQLGPVRQPVGTHTGCRPTVPGSSSGNPYMVNRPFYVPFGR